MKHTLRNIIISRTDSIGDVMLTLPIARVLKDHFPGIYIGFMGKGYTRAVIETCEYVDQFIDVDEFLNGHVLLGGAKPEAILHVFPVAAIAKRAKNLRIPLRIGTTNRLYHWNNCNKLIRLSRKNSDLHEAQLNLKLLGALGIDIQPSLEDISGWFGLTRLQLLPERLKGLLSSDKYNLILHPKSQGSAREWGIPNFVALINMLDNERYNILVSGTEKERALLNDLFAQVGDQVTDITGLMNLQEFISFINKCDGLVANSTGPLHIAAALGKQALGIYPPIRPMHPGRWAPLGVAAKAFVLDRQCDECRNRSKDCTCITQIAPALIADALRLGYKQ